MIYTTEAIPQKSLFRAISQWGPVQNLPGGIEASLFIGQEVVSLSQWSHAFIKGFYCKSVIAQVITKTLYGEVQGV